MNLNKEKQQSKAKGNVSLNTTGADHYALNIFALANRGMLLDIFVFLTNLFLMRWLTHLFLETARAASADDFPAGAAMFLFLLGIFMLLPVGAVLKRRHFHERLQSKGKGAENDASIVGCLFNPIIYFCLNITIYCALNAFVMNYFYGDKEPSGQVFISSVLFGIVLVIFQTFIVYRYFTPPSREPLTEFMRGPSSEILGDLCIFLNMILFQILWNLVTTLPMFHESGILIAKQIFFRFIFLFFVSLFIYFPPRIFYLAEDITHRRVWLTILLANSPVIFRVVIGAVVASW